MPVSFPLALRMTDVPVAFHSRRRLPEIRALPIGSRVRLVSFGGRYVATKFTIVLPPPGAPSRAQPLGWWSVSEA